MSGLQSQLCFAKVVKLQAKLGFNSAVINIAQPVNVWFAVAQNSNEAPILTLNILDLLKTVEAYHVIFSPKQNDDEQTLSPIGTSYDDRFHI